MTKEDNPYYSLIGMMQEEGRTFNPIPFFIGKVTATEPLTVQVGDIPIERKSMKINTFLLKGYQRRWNLALTEAIGSTDSQSGGGGDSAFASHAHGQETIGITDGTFTTLDDFKVGDEVLLLVSTDGQQYVLLCKLA